jgi:hypothetical protein
MKRSAGSHPENFYWKEGDMHFSFKGLQEHSAAVAAFMASTMIDPKAQSRHAYEDGGSSSPAQR